MHQTSLFRPRAAPRHLAPNRVRQLTSKKRKDHSRTSFILATIDSCTAVARLSLPPYLPTNAEAYTRCQNPVPVGSDEPLEGTSVSSATASLGTPIRQARRAFRTGPRALAGAMPDCRLAVEKQLFDSPASLGASTRVEDTSRESKRDPVSARRVSEL